MLESVFSLIKKRPKHRCFPVNTAKFLRTAFFIEHLPWLLLKGSINRFFTGKFPDSGKLYQHLELEYVNQRRWWDMYVCFMFLLNVQYIMLNKFNKNSSRHSDLTYFLAEQNYKEMKKTSGLTKMPLNRN